MGLKKVQGIGICNHNENRQYRIAVISAKLVLNLIGEQKSSLLFLDPRFRADDSMSGDDRMRLL